MWKGVIQYRPISNICLRDSISTKHRVEDVDDHLSINSVAVRPLINLPTSHTSFLHLSHLISLLFWDTSFDT